MFPDDCNKKIGKRFNINNGGPDAEANAYNEIKNNNLGYYF